ncbi:MAG: TetR/AcrR family transcriptional regulator [Firmicutes bacterium]|nr:TetR/AcrR family transcriptional regulator [Bacillota bacterium]
MAVIKETNIKQDILYIALDLFYERGYDNTSISTINKEVGISRGGFYHYYKSKDEVLVSISKEYAESVIELVLEIANDNGLNAVEKINKMIKDVQKHNKINKEIRYKISKIYEREGNIKLQKKILDTVIEMAREPYKKIIEQGVKEGNFKTSNTKETTEFLIRMGISLKAQLSQLSSQLEEKPENAGVIKEKILFYEEVFEKVLGSEKGTINLKDIFLDIYINNFTES